MTSPFRFDGTGEPETEEERRKRQLREAMRAAQLGLPLASQLPAVTITAPRSSMLDASARRTADITSAFESALAETERRRQSPMERLAGFEMPEVAPDVTAAPTGRTRRRPATISAQPEEESALAKALNVPAQALVQPMLAGARFREAVESTPLGRLTPGTATGARRTQEVVEERFGPKSGLAQAVAIPAAFAGEVVPYVAAGGGIPGLLRSAAITGLTSQRPGGSTVEALGELTDSERLKRLAESPLRTAVDVGLDVGMNVLPGAVSGLTAGFREAARATRGGVGTTRALARQAAQNIADGARQMGPAVRALGQPVTAEALTTPTLGQEFIGGQPTLAAESRSFGPSGYIKAPEGYSPIANLLGEQSHRDNVRRIIEEANPGNIFARTTKAKGAGIFGKDISPNTITRWSPDTDDATVRRASAILGLAEGQDAQLPHRLAKPTDAEMPEGGLTGKTFGGVIWGKDETPLTPEQAKRILAIAQQNGIGGGTFDESNGLLYFLNVKGFTGQTNEAFQDVLRKTTQEANVDIPVRLYGDNFYAEYLDGPDAYFAALSQTPEDIRSARDLLGRLAPEYERFAASIGADVDYTRNRFAARQADLDQRLGAVTPAPELRAYDITGAVPEAVRRTLASPAMSSVVGAAVGAGADEEDRFRGAFVGAAAGAGLAAGVRGTKTYLRNKAALKASGFSPELADAYTIAKGGIDFTGAEAQKIAKAQRGGFRDIVKRGIDSFADAQRELDRLAGKAEARGMAPEASVGTALDIALSSDVTAARALRRGLGVERGGIIDPITREFIGEPLEDVFKPLGGNPATNEQALTYAVALRNVGRYDKAVAAGDANPLRIYGGNAERMIADRRIVEAFSQKPEFQEFANRMEQYFANLSEYAVRSGLWTPQQAQAIRESDTFYVPFKRLIEAYTGGGAGPMGGRPTPGRVGPGVKRFTGSDLMIGNPAETIASYTAALIRRADMYRVGATLVDTVEQLGPEAAGLLTKIDAGDPMARALGVADAEAAYRQLGLPEEEAKQVADLFVRMDDKNPVITRNTPQGKEYYLVNDPAVYNALMTLNPQDGQAAKAIVAIFGPLKRLGTAFATGYSPQFWFGTNIPRDLVVGLAQNPNVTLGDIAVGMREAVKSVVGQSEMVEQLSRAGMGQVSQYGGPPSPEAIARQIAPTTTGQAVAAEVGQAVTAPLRGLERVGRATELPMRLAAARAAQRTAAGAGVSPRGQMALASRRGATATVDFRRRAGTAFERLLENTVMYYGAAKKGGVWFARAAKNNPERMGAAAGVVTLGAVLEYLMSKGEERREFVDRPAGERARYLHVGTTRLALPQEFAALAAGVRLGLAQVEQDDPFAFQQFKESLLNMLPPIYTDLATGDIAAAVTPFPIARQAMELSRNRSAFGDRPIVSQAMERRLPEARRYETTAPTYDVLARGARAIGLEEASPIQAEYAVRGVMGRFAPAVTALTDVAAAPLAQQQAAERVPLPMSRQPLNPVTGFTARQVTRGQSEQEFYNIRSEVQQAKATLSALQTARAEAKKRGDQQALNENTAQVRRLIDENPTFAAVFADRTTKRIDKVFSSLEDKLDKADARRDAITTQFRNKKITGQRARQLLDENDKKRAELFRRGFEILNERVPR